MSKDNEFAGHYFTFPLKFIWVFYKDLETTDSEITERLQEIISYSIYWYMCNHLKEITNISERYEKAKKDLNIHGGTLEVTTSNYKKLQSMVTGREIYTSVKTAFLLDARDGKFPFNTLLLICAVKSLIGTRNFCRTNREAIIKRMFGTNSGKNFSRRQFDNLRVSSAQKGLLTIISAGRGYYVSVRYKPKQLAEEVKKHIEKYKITEQQLKVKEISNFKKNLKTGIKISSN